ncbi:phosphatase PAP2 family protein [Streptomyces sp. PTD5-9]|uniref:phosphatase PAP2 family protein n=1 Tax=Streptomyces sp. PTD5-9 TaxID=3120150 RepID=UPI0030096A8B
MSPRPAGTAKPARPRLRPGPPLLFLLGAAVVYLLAVCTPFGQRAENGLVRGYADQARIFDSAQSAGPPPLKAAMLTLIAGLLVIALITLVRRCWWYGGAALAVVAATVVAAEALYALLPRPDLVHARQGLTDGSFPSGHVAIVAGLVCGAVLVCAPRPRPYVAAAGMVWLAVTAAAVQALYWHRPSDALGATLLACACHRLAVRLLSARGSAPGAASAPGAGSAPAAVRRPRALPAVAGVLVAAGALVAGSREDATLLPLVFSGAALVCVALLRLATGPLAGPGRADGPAEGGPAEGEALTRA